MASRSTISFVPSNGGAAQNPTSFQVDVNDSGQIIGLVYSASMDEAGYPNVSFANLVSTKDALDAVLISTGISSGVSTYTAPSPDLYTSYANPDSDQKLVSSESTSFSGTADTSQGSKQWAVSFTYDYPQALQPGAQESGSPVRTLRVALW